MHRPATVPVFVLFALLALAFPGHVQAEESPAATETPSARALAIRAKLPAPSPAARLAYQGDLTLDGLWAGEVSYAATPKKFSGETLWAVTESVFIDVGGAELHYKASYYLQGDLTLRSGSATCRYRGTKVTMFFSRKKDGYAVLRSTKPAKGSATRDSLTIPLGTKQTYGRVAALLFLRGVPKDANSGTSYELSWFPLWEYATRPATHGLQAAKPAPENDPRLRMTLTLGEAKAATKKPVRPAHREVKATRAGVTNALHVAADTHALVAVAAPKGVLCVVPRGEGGARVKTDEEKPSTTWQQAFLKFGYGYHMARPKLLEEAFHWPSMYQYETEVSKSWDPKHPVETFRDAWIKEFVSQSLRRTRKATERLLSMTLQTGKVRKQTADSLVFAAHANFGGGVQRTYHLKKVDGLWYLWRVDF